MDEYKDINARFERYLYDMDNLFEYGVLQIPGIENELEHFIREYDNYYNKNNVSGADPEFLATIKKDIEINKQIVKDNVYELERIRIEKEKLISKLTSDKAKIDTEIGKLIFSKSRTSDLETLKRISNQIAQLQRRSINLGKNIYNMKYGGKYENMDFSRFKNRDDVIITSTTTKKEEEPKEEETKEEEAPEVVTPVVPPEPAKPKKEVPVGSIAYYVEKGILPKNINPGEWIKICKDLLGKQY